MFILKNNFSNKILSKNKQSKVYKNNFKSSATENEKLKIRYDKYRDENRFLKKQIEQLYEENVNLKKLNSFINFQEFLANSYVSPIINRPFNAQDNRIFAFMDHISKYLIQNIAQLNHKPLVSIILPIWGGKDFIRKSINSVLKQSYKNWELIIINDGSIDDTSDLQNYIFSNKIKILSYEKNKGLSFARNIGLKIAKGEYIMYLNPYNEWDSRYIETMVGAFIELPDADAVYSGQLLYEKNDSAPYGIRFGSFNKPLLHNKNYIDIGSFCHRNYVFKEIGGFDESITTLCEWDYILRISNMFKIFSVPVLLSKYYELNQKKCITENSLEYNEKSSKLLEKNAVQYEEYKTLSHKVSIIIPNYESLNELKECVDSILSLNFKKMVDIIIVDNNSGDNVKKYIKSLESKQIKIILNEVNYGFTYAVKQGIVFSDKDSDILILNNDAVLTEGALEHLQEGAYSYKDCGIIVPHELVLKSPHMNLHVPYANPQFECDVTPSKEHHNIINMPLFHDGELLELNFVPFFCTYIKRNVYNKTLGLDPELGRHYRSDRIFSDFIRHILGLKIYQEPDAYVHHKHQAATKTLRKNKEEFDMMFNKNQWPPQLARKLGYKKPLWD